MAKLFEIQARYTLGTKMPEQGIGLPEDRDAMTAEIRRFLAMDESEQIGYRIGRRAGLFRGLADLADPRRRDRAERLVEELGVTGSNVDDVTDEMVKRFI